MWSVNTTLFRWWMGCCMFWVPGYAQNTDPKFGLEVRENKNVTCSQLKLVNTQYASPFLLPQEHIIDWMAYKQQELPPHPQRLTRTWQWRTKCRVWATSWWLAGSSNLLSSMVKLVNDFSEVYKDTSLIPGVSSPIMLVLLRSPTY